jgi:hypothetical protein
MLGSLTSLCPLYLYGIALRRWVRTFVKAAQPVVINANDK